MNCNAAALPQRHSPHRVNAPRKQPYRFDFNALSRAPNVVRVRRGSQISGQGDRAEYGFQMLTGCVRTVRLLEDGRRQVGAFLFTGDLFGWETVDEHDFGAETVTDVTLRRFRISAMEAHADADHAFAQTMRRYSARQIRLVQAGLLRLGRQTAAERIASFLLEMHERLASEDDDIIRLPMSRTDIADYLGLTLETVCRGLTELRKNEVIEVNGATIKIRNPYALRVAA